MMSTLLIILITCVCGCAMLFASQNGLLANILFCIMLGATFAIVLAFVVALPTLLTVVAAIALAALLAWLGKVEHTAPNEPPATWTQAEQNVVNG